MKCPHCLESFHARERTSFQFNNDKDNYRHIFYIGEDVESNWWLEKVTCPGCERYILYLIETPSPGTPRDPEDSDLIRPKMMSRSPVPSEVPEEFATDYREACLVLTDSPKASAALSRRCLQFILREKAGVEGRNLYEEIEQTKDLNILPTSVVELLDVPRKVGNVAAHPVEDSVTGLIVDVDLWEAEWCLEVIEALYDHFFVVPAKNAERLSRFDQKMSP